MTREEALLKSFGIFIKDPFENEYEIKKTFEELLKINLKLAIKTWEILIKKNYKEMMGNTEGKWNDNVARVFIDDLERITFHGDEIYKDVDLFLKNDFLVENVYKKYGPSMQDGVYKLLAYLIWHERFEDADNIISSVYEFLDGSRMLDFWRRIFEYFAEGSKILEDSDVEFPKVLNRKKRNYCDKWVKKIDKKRDTTKGLIRRDLEKISM